MHRQYMYILCHQASPFITPSTILHMYLCLRLEAHLVTRGYVVHNEPAPLPVPGDAVDAVDHLVHVLHPELCEQLGRHLVYLNQILIIIINRIWDKSGKKIYASLFCQKTDQLMLMMCFLAELDSFVVVVIEHSPITANAAISYWPTEFCWSTIFRL